MSSRFGNYEILYELKSGGMGAVLLGRRRGPGAFEQLVAIKTVRPELANAPAVRAMFLDEAAILARLNHPGIATVHDFGEQDGTLYMVMEYVAGLPLRDVGTHVMPPAVLARAIAEAARGLHAAHEARDPSGAALGLVHRDISPDNLMLGYDGHIKVIDFGIALVKNRQAPVTEFGTVKGKPPYMSPEQVKNEPMDRRSDVWALGVVTWEQLTGHGLFDGDSIYAIARAVEHQEIKPPSQILGAPLPLGLDAAVMNALDRNVATRTASAAAFAESLEQVLQSAAPESLAAWTERELAEPRETHRAWLSSVVSGGTALPRAVGRSSAQVTELAPLGPSEAVAPVVATHVAASDERDPGTSIGGTAGFDVSRRRLGPLVVVLLVLLMVGGGVVYVATRSHAVAVVARDAAVDAKLAIDAARVDAPVVVVDAAVVAVDAAPRRAVDAHAAVKVDAAVAVVTADAIVVQAVGKGFVTIKFKDHYKNATVDGKSVGALPVLRHAIAAGAHTVVFTDPSSGAVVDEQTITVKDGAVTEVMQR